MSASEPTSTPLPIPVQKTGTHGTRALIDTSALTGLNEVELRRLASGLVASTLTIAELSAGQYVAKEDLEKQRRQKSLQQVEARIEVLPFDLTCAQAYGLIYAAVARIGRKPRGSRAVDLMIAATALAHYLALYTLNARDFNGLEGLIEIVDLSS